MGGDQKSTQESSPPAWAIPYMTGTGGHVGVLPTAEEQFRSSKPEYFPGSTVAPLAPESEIAFSMGADRAMSGSPLNDAAGVENLKTLGGEYLGQGNPYLDAIKQNGLREASKIAGAFGAGGRTGSGAMQDSIAAGYGSAVAPYEFSAYENERNRMGDAMHFAPTLANQDYVDISNLSDIGAKRQAQGQAELTDEVNRHNFNQTVDARKLEEYANLIRGISNGYGTNVTTTPGQSPIQTLAGLLLGAGGAATGLGWRPFA